jgi:hypothetical protein
VGEAKEHGHGIIRVGEEWSKVGSGNPMFLSTGIQMAPFYRQTMQHSLRDAQGPSKTRRRGHCLGGSVRENLRGVAPARWGRLVEKMGMLNGILFQILPGNRAIFAEFVL